MKLIFLYFSSGLMFFLGLFLVIEYCGIVSSGGKAKLLMIFEFDWDVFFNMDPKLNFNGTVFNWMFINMFNFCSLVFKDSVEFYKMYNWDIFRFCDMMRVFLLIFSILFLSVYLYYFEFSVFNEMSFFFNFEMCFILSNVLIILLNILIIIFLMRVIL